VKLLFAGDLSFDWLPKPELAALIRELIRRPEAPPIPEMRLPLLTRARILAQARRVAHGIRAAVADADHFSVNLECALSDRGQSLDKKRYTMRAMPHYVLALRELGVTLACLANNHVLDYGPDGLTDTIRYLDLAQIQSCGLRQTKGSYQTPAILTTGPEKVAVLNYVEPHIIDPNPDLYFAHEPCPHPLDAAPTLETVAATARSMPVVVVLHWGEEWSYLETAPQRDFAHALIDAGASAVIGHHTHLAGIVEEYKGRPIAYSLGNLFLQLPPFSTGRAAPRYMIQLAFEDGACRSYEIITVRSDATGLPASPAAYEAASLSADYLPSAVPRSTPIRFDSLNDVKRATVTICRNGVRQETSWSDHYLSDLSVVQGKVPIGPGWRCDEVHWSGIARHRDFLAPEFLSTNLAHTFDDVTLHCRFNVETPLNRLFLIVGLPELFHNRRKFACPRLLIHLNDRLLFEFGGENLSPQWTVQELLLDPNGIWPGDLLVSVESSKNLYGYLNWRLIGF